MGDFQSGAGSTLPPASLAMLRLTSTTYWNWSIPLVASSMEENTSRLSSTSGTPKPGLHQAWHLHGGQRSGHFQYGKEKPALARSPAPADAMPNLLNFSMRFLSRPLLCKSADPACLNRLRKNLNWTRTQLPDSIRSASNSTFALVSLPTLTRRPTPLTSCQR
jgi:hypothetical protein